MSKTVIHIYGASGSGTSTLGRYIAEQLGYAFLDTDDYFWLPTLVPYTQKRPREERLRMIRQDIEKSEATVLSGSLVGWGDPLIPLFTLAVRLETEVNLRIERLKARERAHFGARLDPGGDMYRNHQDFLAWAAGYDEGGLDMRSRAEHDAWEKQLLCPRILLNGGDDLAYNFAWVLEKVLPRG